MFMRLGTLDRTKPGKKSHLIFYQNKMKGICKNINFFFGNNRWWLAHVSPEPNEIKIITNKYCQTRQSCCAILTLLSRRAKESFCPTRRRNSSCCSNSKKKERIVENLFSFAPSCLIFSDTVAVVLFPRTTAGRHVKA